MPWSERWSLRPTQPPDCRRPASRRLPPRCSGHQEPEEGNSVRTLCSIFPVDRRTRRGLALCVAPAWFSVSCFLNVSYGCARGVVGRRQAGCRQRLAPVGESRLLAGSRAVVGDYWPPSIPPIPRTRTPLGAHRTVWGGAPGVSLRSTPGSLLQPFRDRCLWVSWQAQEDGFSRMNTQRADKPGGSSPRGGSFALPPAPSRGNRGSVDRASFRGRGGTRAAGPRASR
jgi:hypothetical protein